MPEVACSEPGRKAGLPAFKLSGKMRQRDFRGVAGVAEHGFAVEHAPDADAIQASGKISAYPGFHRMSVTHFMQRAIGGNHVLVYPGTVVSGTRRRATAHHLFKGGVAAHFIRAIAQHPGERTGNFEFARNQHHSGVGAPPQDRLAGIEPREYPVAVGVQQSRRGKIAPGCEQSIG